MKKICTGCGRNRRIGKFAMDLSRKDRKRIYCRDCIAIINKRYRSSLIGRYHHKKMVHTWKKKNKTAIKEYNKVYYLKKRHIILYNKRARGETESVLIFDDLFMKNFVKPKTDNRKIITINPKRNIRKDLFD